jgi:hypothetical protein
VSHQASVLVVAGAALLLSSCDDSAKTFGRSYGECVLKNASEGGDQYSREQATEVCLRRFSRAPNATELSHDFVWGGRIRSMNDMEFMALPASVAAAAGPPPKILEVDVINKLDNAMIVGVSVTVYFYRVPQTSARPLSNSVDLVDTMRWEFSNNIAPNETARIEGSFDETTPPPTQHYIISATPKMVVPY